MLFSFFYIQPSPKQGTTLDLIIRTCTYFLIYDTSAHTWKKSSSYVKHDMRQAGMKVDTWSYEIISSKHLVGKCVINGRHNIWHQPCQRCKYTTSVDIQKTRY